MSEHGELLDPETVRFVRLLPGPVDRVWSYLVNPDKRAKWLCGGSTDLHVGGKIQLHFANERLSDEPDTKIPEKYREYIGEWHYEGEVTQCDPPNRLAHTWNEDGHYSEVCYELEEAGDQVRLTLTHTRLKDAKMLKGVCGGWHTHLAILDDVLSGRAARPFWKTHAAMEAEYVDILAERGIR